MGNLTYFTADDGIAGRELWKTDGTVAGTQRVADIFVGATGSNPSNLIVVTAEPGVHTLFFIAQEDNQGRQLFKLENTANAIPWRLTYISNSLTYGSVSNLTDVNGRLHFTAPGTGLPNLPMCIYRVSISRLSAIPISGTNFAGNLVAMGSTLFFTVGLESEPGAPALCKFVNNALFTIRIFPLIPNGEYPIPQQLTVIGTRLFFTAADASRGRELWVTNAAATTASRISDIIAGTGSAGIKNMVNFNGVLHFTAASGLSTGDRIFKTNAGLTDVVTTGGNMQNANNLAAAGTQLFFTMSPQIGGPQLCRLLGAGTVLLQTFPLIPGGEYPIPQKLTPVGNGIFFTAASANEGRELWKSNGSTTQLVSDIRAGLGNANILEIRLSGQDLFLSANDLTAGQEPWRLANATALQGDGTDERTEISETIVTPASVALEIKVYPNPAVNFVNVDLPQNDLTGTLSILSASGQTVRSMQSSEGQTSIQMDVQDLPKGVYLVRWVQSDEQVVLKKLLVQ
ncbi:MAG: T9SS type A sorting domain-containing protein [Phycisphaerae bacterium]|nr:T9SS type A sorting domain-containing protein [Saprospiraceae bacterium]